MAEINIGDDFTDPVLYDVDEDDLYARAVADIQSTIPELEGREGTLEVTLLRALALQVAEVVYALNRLPERTLEGILRLRGLERDPGVGAVSTARFTLSDAIGVTIPLGAQVRLEVAATGESIDFLTTTEVTSVTEATTVDVPIAGVDPSTAPNGLPSGTELELIDALPYVESVATAAPITGGRDPEDDDSYYARGVALLSRLTETLVLPGQFRAAALETAGVGRAWVLDVYDPGDEGDPGDHPGHVTVVVTDDDGLPLSAPAIAALQATLQDLSSAGLAVHVVEPAYEAVSVTVSVTVMRGADPAETVDAVEAALTEYLSPGTWAGGDTVWRNELIALVDRVPGVDRVVTLTPGTDTTFPTVLTLPEPGTFTVTVA